MNTSETLPANTLLTIGKGAFQVHATFLGGDKSESNYHLRFTTADGTELGIIPSWTYWHYDDVPCTLYGDPICFDLSEYDDNVGDYDGFGNSLKPWRSLLTAMYDANPDAHDFIVKSRWS